MVMPTTRKLPFGSKPLVALPAGCAVRVARVACAHLPDAWEVVLIAVAAQLGRRPVGGAW